MSLSVFPFTRSLATLTVSMGLLLSTAIAEETTAEEATPRVEETAPAEEPAPAAGEATTIPLNAGPDVSDWPLEARASYVMGYAISRQVMNQVQQGGFSQDLVMAGLSAGLQGQPPAVPQDTWAGIMETYQQQAEERQRVAAATNQAASEQHLADLKDQEGVTVTESGLAYEVLTEGDGPRPAATNTVRVHYHGTLLDGQVFDSSVERGEPVEFPLNRVIPGWTEGVQKMSVGSKYRFHIPADLAYGSEGRPGIPPNSLLIFEVELLSIIP